MDLQQARENVVNRLIETGQINDEQNRDVLSEDQDPLARAIITSRIAGRLLMWEEAEELSRDPVIQESVFWDGDNKNLSMLGIHACEVGDFEVALSFFERMNDPNYDYSGHIANAYIKHGFLNEAEAYIREKADFSVIKQTGAQKSLGYLVSAWCQREGGPKYALDLACELVPDPESSDIEDKHMERLRMDYFVHMIPPAALLQEDFDTAEAAVQKITDWQGPGAAMGGGGLLDEAYRTENKAVLLAVRALIYKKWGAGRETNQFDEAALQDIPESFAVKIRQWTTAQ